MKTIVHFVISLLVFFGVLAGLNFFMKADAESFCSEVSISDSPVSVSELANKYGYHISDKVAERNKMIIYTQDSPFFRFACVVIFENGKLVKKEVVSGD